MLLHKMLEQFENVSGAEKLGPISSMMLISLWRKAEKLNNQKNFSISASELMILSGIKKVNDFQLALNRLVLFGYINYEVTREGMVGVELNLNLYEPFARAEKQKQEYTHVMDALEKTYLQLKGSGLYVSPIDYEEMRKIADEGIGIEDAVKYLEECFEQYTPKYNGDSIRSFKYCSSYILARHSQEQAKKEALQDGRDEKDPTGNGEQKSKTPREVNEFKERLRARGLLKGVVADINVDF